MKVSTSPVSSASGSGASTPNPNSPFAAGSLLQQRVEAEKQEVENMKLQLKLREQAGVAGSKGYYQASSADQTTGYHSHRHNGGLANNSSSSSSNAILSMSTSPSSSSLLSQQQQQQQQQNQPKFGGPGTLIEQGEARAKLLERSKSAGTGLLYSSTYVNNTTTGSAYNRSRSKSRGPGEDRVAYPYGSGNSSRLPGTTSSGNVPVPNGPLLHFEDENAMIQPGLLLNRSKTSHKQPSLGMVNNGAGPAGSMQQQHQQQHPHRNVGNNTPQGTSRGRQATSNHNVGNSSGSAAHANGGRTRIKPLIDLGNIHTNQDMIGPGLLSSAGGHGARPAPSGSQSARSPRRIKPLLEF
ncbi:hypothetical protein BGZ94_004867 [Podila epigama]|nr:hypothetical protein BGZ94_004867 [Podila epigama]